MQRIVNTTRCRKAYLLTLDNLEDAKFIYPHKRIFLQGELELAAMCRKRISEGEAAATRRILPLAALQADREYQELLNTACVYLLDCDSSVTRTAQALFYTSTRSNTACSGSRICWATGSGKCRKRSSCTAALPSTASSMRSMRHRNRIKPCALSVRTMHRAFFSADSTIFFCDLQ